MHTSIGCLDQLTAVKTGYPLTSSTWPYRGLRCSPIEVKYFLKLSADKLLVFKWSQARVWFFSFIWNMFCFWAAQLKFWFKTDLGPENSASYYRQDSGFDFAHHGHAFVTLYGQFYALIGKNLTGEIMRKIYAGSWILVYFDSWSWQSKGSCTFVGLWKIYSFLFIPNCSRDNVTTYTNLMKSSVVYAAI